MRNFKNLLFAGAVLLAAPACDKFLDVNTNPNAPEQVAANLYLPPMIFGGSV